MIKNIVAYSLWGDHPMYWVGALKNIEQVKNYFPSWVCRFYIDDTCDEELIKTIKGDNVEVVFGGFGRQRIQRLIFSYPEIVILDSSIERLVQ